MQNVDEFIKKIHQSKKINKFDLSSDEDLSLAIMNLISIEEHFFFTAKKTNKDEYFNLLNETRQIRKELLKKLIPHYEGEVWCISKHLLASSMRLMEVGTKLLDAKKDKDAKDMFDKAYNLYSLFWGVNLGAISTKDIKKIDENALNKNDQSKSGFMGKLQDLVKKVVDCCIE